MRDPGCVDDLVPAYEPLSLTPGISSEVPGTISSPLPSMLLPCPVLLILSAFLPPVQGSWHSWLPLFLFVIKFHFHGSRCWSVVSSYAWSCQCLLWYRDHLHKLSSFLVSRVQLWFRCHRSQTQGHRRKWHIFLWVAVLHFRSCSHSGPGPVSLTVFPSQFKFDGNFVSLSPRFQHSGRYTKFCTWHDTCAVLACAKFFYHLMASNGVMARRSFHRIWMAGKKTLVKRAPGHCFEFLLIMDTWELVISLFFFFKTSA